MRLLITGGTGFIGGHLLSKLSLIDGVELVATKRPESLIPLSSSNIKWLTVDDEFKNQLYKLEKLDAILHLATNYGKQFEVLSEIEGANVGLPLILLDFAIKGGCDTFINTDSFFSREVYKYSHMKEYILTKQNFIKWGQIAVEKNLNLRFINARLEHVFGPKDKLEKFIPSLMNQLMSNKTEIHLTSCEQKRDFIYVSDVIDAFIRIIKNSLNFTGFKEIEIGSGTPIPLKVFVKKLKMYTGSNSRLCFNSIPQRQGEIMSSFANIEVLRSLGWKQQIELDEGISLLFNDHE